MITTMQTGIQIGASTHPAPCDDIKELENDKDDCNNVQYAEAYVV